jgi:hypothetical protein
MTKRPECFSKILSLLFAAVILFMVFPSAAAAADFTLGWNPNQEEDLSGYKIHYKEKSYGEPGGGPNCLDNLSIELNSELCIVRMRPQAASANG